MSISSINYSSSVLGAQIRNINQQLTDLSTQLSTGKLSQNYSGMGTNEGFAIASRSQLSNIAAYTDTITNGMGRLVQTQPTPSSVNVVEDSATSPFGLKIAAVSSSLTGATLTGPSGSPVSFSVDLNGVNPNNGDKLSVQFTLPDGSTEQIDLTASSATPTPVGSFA